MISQEIKVGQILYSYFYKGNTLVIKEHTIDSIEEDFVIINSIRNRYDIDTLSQEYYSHDSPMKLYRSEQEIKDEQEYQNLRRSIEDTIERGGCLTLDKARRISSILQEK